MPVNIFIQLLDEENKPCMELWTEFENESTLMQLKEKIHSHFFIPPYRQVLFLDEQKISYPDTTCFKALNLVEGSKIILEHDLMKNWRAFDFLYKEALKEKGWRVQKIVIEAQNQLDVCMSDKFFATFPLLSEKSADFSEKFSRFLDMDRDRMEFSVRHYFSQFYNDSIQYPKLTFIFNDKVHLGAQGGFICQLQKEGFFVKFHVKTHLGVESRCHCHERPDLREIFLYKFFQNINVGPEVHFIPDTLSFKVGLYIATKHVEGFKCANEVSEGISVECQSQLEILRQIFYLTDLHSSNFGIDAKSNLFIVDFQVKDHKSSVNLKDYFQNRKKEWIELGITSFEKWNIEEVLEDTDKSIKEQKALFKDRICLKSSEDYGEYLIKVQKNIELFKEAFKCYTVEKSKGGAETSVSDTADSEQSTNLKKMKVI